MTEIMQGRHKNYVAFLEESRYRYTKSELYLMSEMELMNIMPQNQCIEEYSETFGYFITKAITAFRIHKIIDGTWRIGYFEGNVNKTEKEQLILKDISYVHDLKKGLMELYNFVEDRKTECFEAIKEGRVFYNLSEDWDRHPSVFLPEFK